MDVWLPAAVLKDDSGQRLRSRLPSGTWRGCHPVISAKMENGDDIIDRSGIRACAERQMKTMPADAENMDAMSAGDMVLTIHELRVYQIEWSS
ncbi:MAG: hypothetical protein KFF68_02385 [Desulfosarcina sp.]|nr:hypothetical protein [Desulfosarcina sp.]